MKKITVVIPNYNGERYLADCLLSLQQQEAGTPDFDILVVDNGSSDQSMTQAGERFPDVRQILLKENTGFCHAVNVGIRESAAPFVILLNNDTKVKPGFVRALYEAIGRDEKIFSVSSKMLMWDRPDLVDDAGDRYCVLGWAFSRGKGKKAESFDAPAEIFASCGGAAIYRRSALEEIGLFDEQHFAYLEDVDIGWRSRIRGYRSFYEPQAEVLHYGSASTGSKYNEKKTLLASRNSVYLIGKNMPLLQLIVNAPFLLMGFSLKFLFFCKKKMGILYLKGLWEGCRLCFSEQGRAHKVPFRWHRLGYYLRIQLQFYRDTFRIITKS